MSQQGAGYDPFIPLEGAGNFRDVGGVPVIGGGHVRRGMLYRANQMSQLTDADHAVLAPLNIRVLHDLRQGEERDRAPTRWPGPQIVAATERDQHPRWQEVLAARSPDVEGARGFLIDLYARLPFDFAPRIALILRGLAAGEGPCVVHCSAGKDRTGVVIALLLALAGATPEEIEAEYLLTAGRTGLSADQRRAFQQSQQRHARTGRPITDEMHMVLTSVDTAFLEAAFDAVTQSHGDLDSYARDALRLSEAERDAYRRAMIVRD